MKPTSKKAGSAPQLGTKRTCPKCATKFYDFNKEEITCPKCRAKIDPEALNAPLLPKAAEPKKAPKAAVKDNEDPVSVEPATAESEFESVEELADDEEALVEDMGVDDESEF